MPREKTRLSLPSVPDPTKTSREHAYFNADGSINGKRLLAIVNATPGAFNLIMLEGMIRTNRLRAEYREIVESVVKGLSAIVIRAAYHADRTSADQLRAIQKVAQPEKYELPHSKIREIAERYETRPALARGWELRKLMSYLSFVVEPLRADKPYSPDQPIRVMESSRTSYDYSVWSTAKKHFKVNSTLQSLAIRIYLAQLSERGVTEGDETITERTLKRDLAEVRKWEETATDKEKERRGYYSAYRLSGEPLTWCDYSEGWKERRKKRPKSKGGTKSSRR